MKKYKDELKANPAFAALEQTLVGKSKVTLLYSSHDRKHNNAVVVQEMLEDAEK